MVIKPVDNMVQSMRQIRDEISNEIKDMTFAEERAFLDKLLNIENPKVSVQKHGDTIPKN
jgi:hypothetical protein